MNLAYGKIFPKKEMVYETMQKPTDTLWVP